jgi:hypothetical protein
MIEWFWPIVSGLALLAAFIWTIWPRKPRDPGRAGGVI